MRPVLGAPTGMLLRWGLLTALAGAPACGGSDVADLAGTSGSDAGGYGAGGSDATATGLDASSEPGGGGAADMDGYEPDAAAGADAAKTSEDGGPADAAGGGGWLDGPVPRSDLAGWVLVYELDTGSGELDRGNALAAFGPPNTPAEAEARFGPCDIMAQAPDVLPAITPGADAGPISIAGTAIPLELTWTPYDAVYVSSVPESNATVLGKADAPILVTAAGGTHVPPFSGTIVTPAAVELSTPELGLTSQVGTDEPLGLSWIQDTPGKVTRTTVVVAPVGLDLKPIKGKSVVCTVPGDPGALTIPLGAMQSLPSSFGTRLVVSVTRVVETVVDAGGVPVTLAATATFGGVATAK